MCSHRSRASSRWSTTLGDGHQHCHEHEENDAEGDDSGSTDVEEDRDVNADVVPTVGEGDAGDGRHGNALTRHGGIIVVALAAVDLPRSPENQPEGDEPRVEARLGSAYPVAKVTTSAAARIPTKPRYCPAKIFGRPGASGTSGEEERESTMMSSMLVRA